MAEDPSSPGMTISPNSLAVMKPPDRQDLLAIQKASQDINLIVQQTLRDRQDEYERYYNQGRIPTKYEIGDLVDLNRTNIDVDFDDRKPKKLLPKWIGPYKVTAVGPHPDTYHLDLEGTALGALWPYFHVNVLRIHVPSKHEYRRQPSPELEPVIVRGQPEYHIERILDERIYRKKRQVLVKWKGYRDPTWELESQVKNTDAFKTWRTDHRPI